ncbi:hypothetical protein LR48_Vigan03g035800 [Vigna angularis]|uniref:Dihydrodipicolinate reductase C-terminal domain-containing protein n=1 Tax=Phaseolus angularis TaxID=3914 RepID=A0A0L9U2U1_PHAAN|nr:hypothetical protein LR48_Vigan03g035800 [Vigna angularis]
MATSFLKTTPNVFQRHQNPFAFVANSISARTSVPISQKRRSRSFALVSMSATPVETSLVKSPPSSQNTGIPIMVNACTGKMGKAVINAGEAAGLNVVPVSFGCDEESGQTFEIGGKEFLVHGPSDRESALVSALERYPNLIVVDYTVPNAVNDCNSIGAIFNTFSYEGNAELYCKVVAFLAAMEIMAEQFPGAFSGYSLQVLESHQASKVDASGTAKAVISCFNKLGVSFDMDQIKLIRDPRQQLEMVGVPEEHLSGHAFHMYHLTSPDDTVSFEFQHNVCGRSIYAEGTVDAVLFLAKKIEAKDEKRLYNMIDVLREGNMR